MSQPRRISPLIRTFLKSGDLPKAKVIHGRARWLYRDHCEFKNKLLSRANG
ncbi:excisionase [Escherichia coli]|uniref:excisionase n=1 Tax=Escherichia coli TaxID=562 RepID=UPI0031F2F950